MKTNNHNTKMLFLRKCLHIFHENEKKNEQQRILKIRCKLMIKRWRHNLEMTRPFGHSTPMLFCLHSFSNNSLFILFLSLYKKYKETKAKSVHPRTKTPW